MDDPLCRKPSLRRDNQGLDARLQRRMDDRREQGAVVDREFVEPAGLEHALICRQSGLLARPICPSQINEVFLPGQKPTQVCNLQHEPRFEEAQHDFGQRLGDFFKRRFGSLFGGGEEKTDKPEGAPPEPPPGETKPPAPPPPPP